MAWSTGTADAQLVERTESARVALLSATSLWAIRLSDPLLLALGVRAALALPELRMRFSGTEVARFGRPLADASVSLQYCF